MKKRPFTTIFAGLTMATLNTAATQENALLFSAVFAIGVTASICMHKRNI